MNIQNYIQNSLLDMGFTEGEAKLYFDVLNKNGEADASILKKDTKYSTAGIYKLLDSLIEKGFIIPNNRTRPVKYVALPLQNIGKKIANKGRKFGRIANKFEELGKLTKIPIETEIYEENDLTDFYMNIPYKIEDFIWCVGSFKAAIAFFGKEIEQEFINIRAKKGKFADVILFDNSEYSKDLAKRDNIEKRETKIIGHDNFPLEFSYQFNDTVLDFYGDADGKVKVLASESPTLARSRLIMYQRLWNSTCQ